MQDGDAVKLEEQSITILRDNNFREVSKDKLETYLYNLMEEYPYYIFLDLNILDYPEERFM